MATLNIDNVSVLLRRDTASNWATENPVLLAGELGVETDTLKGKIGDGSTTWNNLSYAFQDVGLHEDDLLPLATKTYTGLYANPNDFGGGTFYFAKVIPNNFYTPWFVTYRVHAYVPNQNNYDGVYTVQVCGCQATIPNYKAYNSFYSTSYRPLYSHIVYRAKAAGATTYGHLLGTRIYSATNGNVAAYARVLEIEILSTANCTATLFDNVVLYADAPGTGTTNYDSYSELNGYDNGTKMTGDVNQVDRTVLGSYNAIAGTGGIKQYALIMQDADGNWQGFCNEAGTGTTKTKNTVGFRLGRVYYSYSSANYASGERVSAIYEHLTKDLRYDCNCGTTTFTEYKPIYVKGSLHSDGLFYLADDWITQTLPTTEDGYLYIDIGRTYNKYCVSLGITKPIFYYKDGAIREYAYTASSESVAWSDVTNKPTFATVATSGSYNDLSNKPTIPTVPANVSAFTNDSGYITSAHEKNNTRNIEYIVGTQTATTGAWKGVTQDTALYDGKLILYFLPQAGSGNATLELTFPNQTTTGAIPVYVGYSGVNGTRMTTHAAVKTQGAPILLAYDATNNVWCGMQYWTDSNTYDRNLLNDVRVYAGTNKIMNYSLIMQKADGKWESFTTTSGTATTKAKNTNGFRLGRIWVYNYNETINSGSLTRNDYLYDCIPHTLTYSTNCGTTLTAREPVYLVGTINSTDGLFYLDNTWWTQTEPSTEDGKVYIYLGDAYSTSAIYKVANNLIYQYKNGSFGLYGGGGGSVESITDAEIDEIISQFYGGDNTHATAITNNEIDAIVSGNN